MNISREDVLRVVGEPVACIEPVGGGKVEALLYRNLTEGELLYTEAQLLAMYAAGAEAMRERAKERCDQLAKLYPGEVAFDKGYTMGATRAATEIAALPITPTNTEGEQG